MIIIGFVLLFRPTVEFLYQLAHFGNVEEVVKTLQLIVGLDAFVDVLAFQECGQHVATREAESAHCNCLFFIIIVNF